MSGSGQLSPGSKCDRYEIVRLIGAGGMGEVYMALHEFTKKAVALKVLKVSHVAMQEHVEKMRAEAMVLCRIKHDNLVEVYDAGITQVDIGGQSLPMIWMAMELLEGESLRERLVREGAIRPGLALRWAAAVAEGLQAAHDEGVIHRDLKPENIFITKAGKVRVLDFGTAMFQGFGQQTDHGEGTIPYMSPEQLGHEQLDARSDIYALGYIVYEMLAGRHPFSNPDGGFPAMQQLINMHIAGDPESLEAHVGAEVWGSLAAAIAKDRQGRYASMRDMGGALLQLASRYGENSGALRLTGASSTANRAVSSTGRNAMPSHVGAMGQSGVTPAPIAHTPPPTAPSGVTGGTLAGLAVASLVAGAAAVLVLRPTAPADVAAAANTAEAVDASDAQDVEVDEKSAGPTEDGSDTEDDDDANDAAPEASASASAPETDAPVPAPQAVAPRRFPRPGVKPPPATPPPPPPPPPKGGEVF